MDEKVKEILSLAVESFQREDFESAEKSFLEALEIEPENALIRNNYAMLLKKTKRFVEAEENFKRALFLEPSNVQIQKNYGNLLKARNSALKEE